MVRWEYIVLANLVTTLTAACFMGQISVGVPQEPPSLHAMELAAHANDPLPPKQSAAAKIQSVKPAAAGLPRPCKTIFGYLPYWESAANIRWNILTHLACFSVGANANGTISNPRNWPTAEPFATAIANARANNVKVILTVTLFDDLSIITLINNPSYKNAFFSNLKAQMLAGDADGVNIDFETSSDDTSWQSTIHLFMGELTNYLHAEIPGCEVSYAGPPVNWGSRHKLDLLAASCDYIFIMGYNFYGSWSGTSGPCAPLTSGSINMTNTIDVQYGTVTRNNPEKLILGYPVYGGHWKTKTSDPRSEKVAWVGSTRFRDDYAAAQTYGYLWDAPSQTPWYRWHDGKNWHQVWYDDAASIGLKCQLALDRNLKGVGMWALNYDGDLPYIWDELESRFATGADADGDGIGDACDPCTDTDGDGYGDSGYPANTCPTDACPGTTPGLAVDSMGCSIYPGDFDQDGDVDSADLSAFLPCLSVSGGGYPAGCWRQDLDNDEDVDQDDFGMFQRCLSGQGLLGNPNCTQ